jgi:GH25 family lysozyme M1 (1,4-beta-N-acetylmuramidase)
MSNAAGEDRSSFQRVSSWGGNAFAFAKATEGTNWSDPAFASNWAGAAAQGKVRGAYHFFHPADSPSAQAQFFVSSVKAHGLRAGDVLIADVEIAVGERTETYGTWQASARSHEGLKGAAPHLSAASVGPGALQFLQDVAALAGPHCKVLLYTDVSMAQSLLGACSGYPLFIAYYASAPVAPAPWKTWTFWQNGAKGPGGGDLDYFNGNEAALAKWANPAPAPLPPGWVYPPVQKLTAAGGETSVRLSWDAPVQPPGEAPMPGIGWYQVAVTRGPRLEGAQLASYPRWVRKGSNPEAWQGGSIPRGTQCTAGVRAADESKQHAPAWETVTFSTT